MRTAIIIMSLLITSAWSSPFNTVPAYTLEPEADYFGPQVPVRIPLVENGFLSSYPMIWAGFGVVPNMDANFMMLTGIEPGETGEYSFNFYYLMAEARYEAVEAEGFSLTPVLDLFIPLDVVQTVGLGPGVMASVGMDRLELHANLLSNVDLVSFSTDIFFFISPEVHLNPDFSVFAEGNLTTSLEESELSNALEFWAGASWEPTYWLSLSLACGVPSDLSYLSPGLAVYVNF